ncbi:MAG: hypothetical protein HQL67_12130 [Magnetococcales bacterium]|nr:hypothetical protein [Magnetococcales bacterium]
MEEIEIKHAQGLTPEGINKLERLKGELEKLNQSMQNLEGKSQFEIEDHIRSFQNKESEIKHFLRELGLLS